MTATSSHSAGLTTNQTVSATNSTSAPRFRKFLPGSTSGADLMRADSLRKATIEPVNVTAPMKTPMNTSAEWIESRPSASSSCASDSPSLASTCR